MPTRLPLVDKYTPPAVTEGGRVYCRYRRGWRRVVGWTDAPIPWPLVRQATGAGGGLWVNRELERAIRTETPAALAYWFGVSPRTVRNWRQKFGVEAPGRPRPSAPAKPQAEFGREAERLGVRQPRRWNRGGWTPADIALLGTDHDEAVARRVGRSATAVTNKRLRLRIPPYKDRRVKGGG